MGTHQTLGHRVRQWFRLPVLLLVLIAWIPLTLWSLLMTQLPRRRLSRGPDHASTMDLTVLAPFSPGSQSGGAQAISGLLSILEERFQIRLIDLSEHKPPLDKLAALAFVLTLPLPVPDHCRRLLLGSGTVTSRLETCDALLIEFPGPALFLPLSRRPGCRVILRDHEVLLRKLTMELRAASGPLEIIRRGLGVGICYLACLSIYCHMDGIITLTREDREYLERWYPFLHTRIRDIPVHFQCPGDIRPSDTLPASRELMFVGNFFHEPNVDALRWFLAEVAPALDPGFKLHLCGIDDPLDHVPIDNPYIQVIRHGFVDDIEEHFRHVGIAIAPIVSGGGVRMKNLHLACLGKAIVSTTLANQGIGFTDGVDAVITDDGPDMARRINRLAASPEELQKMGRAARVFVQTAFDRDQVATRLEQVIRG